ncbi:transporter substrate-binding domain-containing protein [Parendozoicomonas sp. Alg238-R29]|uniref:transporter substrate-binding domain-containing protein n=1 Tax=Parendozoicomonas sp. Alg238-R29 TaxID=2993446 RepID=UPI00248EA8D1|nr:transporter substrate-binding domain-containing protein [Parendozoicomonas sp. Alg238-R29]
MFWRSHSIAIATAVFSLISIQSQAATPRETIQLCSDNSYWFPFTLMKDYRAEGVFIDMIKEVGERTGKRIVVRPTSWSRCLRLAKQGKIDGILGASYKDERNEWMEYPADAEKGKSEEHSMSLVDYVIATPTKSSYVYDGKPASLPGPVRVPRSYSIADDLKKQSAPVKNRFSTDRSALVDLVRMETGSAALMGNIAEQFQNNRFFKGKYTIQKVKLKSKNYYLTFSRKSELPEETRIMLWDALRSVREDEDLMSVFYSKYLDEAEENAS